MKIKKYNTYLRQNKTQIQNSNAKCIAYFGISRSGLHVYQQEHFFIAFFLNDFVVLQEYGIL